MRQIRFFKPREVLLALLLLLCPVGCGEDSYGPTRQAADPALTAEDGEVLAGPSDPVLFVGTVALPMPLPAGFKRVPQDSELLRAMQDAMPVDEVLLCLFERSGEGTAGLVLSAKGLPLHDTFVLSTLRKWLDVEVSSLDFLKLKQSWQEDSLEFDQNTLLNFEEAAKMQLSSQSEFNYNLGLIDSSPLHISFLQVTKHNMGNEQAVYSCSSTSLLWRYGKIFRFTYSRRIDTFSQIQSVVAESVGYIQKLQALDRNTRLQSGAVTSLPAEPPRK